MDLELRHLKVVCAVAESGSVTKAAAALGLAQPALTAQLKRIERTLGGPLFERDRRGARATPLGELVLARARVLLPAAAGLAEEAARFANNGHETPQYRIGSTAGPILGGLIDRLAAAQPEATITTYASGSVDDLAEMTLSGRLDFTTAGLCEDAALPAESDLSWRTIAVDAMVVLLPDEHPLAWDEVELGDLRDAHWAIADGHGQLADQFAAACARAGFTPRAIYETDISGCVDLVRVGRAVALSQPTLPLAPGVTRAPIKATPLRIRQLLGWHPATPAAQGAARVLGHARNSYADAVRRCGQYARWLRDHPDLGIQTTTP